MKLLTRNLVLIGLAGFLLIGLLIYLISKRITSPLIELSRITSLIGAGDFDIPVPEVRTKDEIAKLSNAIINMQRGLKDHITQLTEITAEKERMMSELRIAGEIQKSILPKETPLHHNEGFEIIGKLHSAREVGGDLFDFFLLEDNFLCFAVGDVSGKGVPASLFMSMARTLYRVYAQKFREARHIMHAMNKELSRDNDQSVFVTFIAGTLEMDTGKFSWCNAGHNPPYLVGHNKSLMILEDKHGIPLGLYENQLYRSSEKTMKEGETLVFYTDGITEALSPDDTFFGEERLMKLITNEKITSSEKLNHLIIDEVNQFVGKEDQSDDLTVLTIHRKE